MNKHILLILAAAFMACSKSENNPPVTNPPVVTPPATPLITLPSGWVKSTALMAGFPAGIEVYQNTTSFNSKALVAYAVVFDPKNTAIEFKPVLPATNKKVSELYAAEGGVKYAAINGGFFGTNASYSLVQYNGAIESVNIKSVTRTYNGAATAYYPTRAAFGITASGQPQTAWIYHVGAGNGTVYSYPLPSPNDVTLAPQAQPSASFPSGGSPWVINSAIGGSPMLIRNNQVQITDKEELIDINNTTSRARSAIGHTANGLVILLAVEGNNPNGGVGLNLQEMADLMKSMGCTGAVNLDGGGSTYMTVNGQQTVKPSDVAGERPVMSAIIIRKK